MSSSTPTLSTWTASPWLATCPRRKNLAACSECLGIDLEHHHNAECDAVACAEIAIACTKATTA